MAHCCRKTLARLCRKEVAHLRPKIDNPEELRFFGLYASGHTYHFWFVVRLAIDSAEIHRYHRPGEFSRLLALSEQEAQNISPTTPMFRLWLPYLHLVPGFLESARPSGLP